MSRKSCLLSLPPWPSTAPYSWTSVNAPLFTHSVVIGNFPAVESNVKPLGGILGALRNSRPLCLRAEKIQ